MTLRIHRFLPQTRAEGPGLRACLWVQGCPIHCAGCAVPWTWDFEGGTETSTQNIIAQTLASPDIEGITFLGGEPFSQAQALAEIGQQLKAQGLSVMTFSGHTLENLRKADRPDWNALLAVTDLLVDGPFRHELLDTSRPWVGSSNQRYHFLSDCYRPLQSTLLHNPNRLEIRLTPDGKVELNGLATQDEIWQLISHLTF